MAVTVAAVGRQTKNAGAQELCPAQKRAIDLWPRLNRRAILRCGCDPARIARHVARRTQMPPEAIEKLLTRPN